MRKKSPISARLTSGLRLGLGVVLTSSTVVTFLAASPTIAFANSRDPLKIQAPEQNWPFYHASVAPYKVRIVHDGLTALELRLRMIERAQKNIDIMVYLFGTDASGEIVLHALMKKALEGVHVRVLVDFYNDNGRPDLSESVIEAVRQNLAGRAGPGGLRGSFEVRYYNPGELLKNPGKMNHRNHAKLINIDNREVLVGGRNIGDDYFSLENEDVSYLDRDVYVHIPDAAPVDNVGNQTADAFDAYWNSSWVAQPKPWPQNQALSDGDVWTAQPGAGSASDIAAENNLRLDIAKNSLPILGSEDQELRGTSSMPTFNASQVGFVIDRPGHSHDDRETTYVVNSEIVKARRYLLLENYTFASTTQHQNLLLKIANEFLTPVVLLTNGFETGDNGVLTRFEYEVEKHLLAASRNLWTLDMTGQWEPGQPRIANHDHPKLLATHSKTAVVYTADSATTLIGSYNFDGRSEIYNNEDILIVENNPWVAQETANGVMHRAQISRQLMIGPDGKLTYRDGTQIPESKRTFVEKLARFLGLKKLMRSLY